MSSNSSLLLPEEDNVLFVVDHVPETMKDVLPVRNSSSSTPETLSLLTEMDESLSDHLASANTSPKTIITKKVIKQQGKIHAWCRTKHYSDLVRDGLKWLAKQRTDRVVNQNVVMVFESPSTADPNSGSSFYNDKLFQFYDYPLSTNEVKSILAPLRYSAMTGNALPTYIQSPPPPGLTDHWAKSIPDCAVPTFCHEIPEDANICAYLPLEQFVNRHMIDPQLHYEIAGKDDIPHMTPLTTKVLPDMSTQRPCIVKMTHCMGSKGIFVIRNDDDEKECRAVIQATGNPSKVVTEYVDIERNLAAHFFIHPSGDITWFGSSENLLDKDGIWSADATIHNTKLQDELQEQLSPYVQDVVQYCVRRGYWGACGIDVLMERSGRGYVVDVNPRVTGTCPAVMAFQRLVALDPTRFQVGTFRRSKKYAYPGTMAELFQDVDEYNEAHVDTRVIIFSALERDSLCTYINIGVFGVTQVRCVKVLNKFARKLP